MEDSGTGRNVGPAEIRRRTLIGGVLGIAVSVLFAKDLGTQVNTLGDRLGAPDARELFRDMFGSVTAGATTSLKAGRQDFRQGFHPDNYAAGVTLRKALRLRGPDEVLRDEEAYSGDEFILVGGTNSTDEIMVAWEASGPDRNRLSRPEERGEQPIIPLRWFGSSDREDPEVLEEGAVGWSMEREGGDDDYVSTVNWAVWDSKAQGKNRRFAGKKGSALDRFGRPMHILETNDLIITRMPSIVHPSFLSMEASTRPYMTVFQGMHGPGTRGIELLLTGDGFPALEAAHNALKSAGGGKAYPEAYQLLFNLSGLGREKDYRGGLFHAFHEIQFEDCDLLSGDYRVYERAHVAAMERLQRSDPWRAKSE